MVTLAVLGILAALGAPSFLQFMATSRVEGAAQELKAALDLARSQAIATSLKVGACISPSGSTCQSGNSNWGGGWLVWVDRDGDNSLDSDEIVKAYGPVSASITLTGNSETVMFSSLGSVTGTPAFTVAHTTTSTIRYVCVANSGSSKVQSAEC
jgi:type IV fimbrial biogenesis protein FimT